MTMLSDAAVLSGTASRVKRPRDPRLDVFRGIGMLIILLAHIPNDHWALWIPARFGFSDATEMFVFLSGMASAIAFGRLFDREGIILLTGRILQRIWQIYWSHLCVFLVIATLMSMAGTRPDGVSYVDSLNLVRFFTDPAPLLLGLMTLTYVPNYFDILPMYMVILALLPIMLLVERMHRVLPLLLMAGLWVLAQISLLNLPAEPWSDRPWFFNPFGWQLLFFLGFFLMRGTIQAPPARRSLKTIAALILIASIPFAWYRILEASPFFRDAAHALLPLTDKSTFGLLRLVHFLALAYLAFHAVGEGGRRLVHPRIIPVTRILMKVGQQSLAVFVTGMVVAQIIGIWLDRAGHTPAATALANLAGFSVLIATAYLVAWFKVAPWKA
ncbi:OpgC family protein [Rhizobium sp. YIM 134829]|uniref:OpgC family protein n=1 Tax=Rhizobium sp. YIM 134829 TaxID=3390453 RepID=UPI0039795B37